MTKYRVFVAVVMLLGVASCSSPKKTIYFNTNEKADTLTTMVSATPRPDLIINTEDIVAINVSSIDPKTRPEQILMFNNGGIAVPVLAQSGGGVQQSATKGYLVDIDSSIDFPAVGSIKIGGLSLKAAKEVLAHKLSEYINAPVVEIRIINYKVNIIGEVSRVGPVMAPNHKMNILEALSAAGDIPITGRKDNVLVIREKDGKQEFGRVNLNSTTLFTSPYYYLQQNDVVYVEPNKIRRQETNEFLRFYLPTFAAILTSLFSIYGIVQLSNNNK